MRIPIANEAAEDPHYLIQIGQIATFRVGQEISGGNI